MKTIVARLEILKPEKVTVCIEKVHENEWIVFIVGGELPHSWEDNFTTFAMALSTASQLAEDIIDTYI